MVIVEVTNTQRIRQTSEYKWLKPSAKAIVPDTIPIASGHPKLRRKLSVEVFRQANSGPTPVRNISRSPRGIFTLLKKGAPTLMRFPVSHSENTGKSVPESTATQATSSTRLLKRKLDSRETIAPR